MNNTINTQKTNATKINGNCKGVRCLTDGKFYPGMKYAAQSVGVTSSSMSYAIKHKTFCKGKKYAWEMETEANVMEMGRQISDLTDELAEFRKWKAEREAERIAEERRLEAERKAKEEHDKAITKAQEKVAKYESMRQRKAEQLKSIDDKLMQAEIELEALLDGKEVA